jgi:ribose transport system permease protein
VLVVLTLVVVVLSISEDQFLTPGNIINILETNSVLLVVAVGLTFVLLVGGIDLSLGGTMALTAVSMWGLLTAGVPAPLAACIVVVGAFTLGAAVNGLLIGWVGLSFLVVTIGTASVFRGIALLGSGGQSKSLFDETWLVELGSGRVLGIPILVIVSLSIFLLGVLVLRYTGYGRMVYAVGGNPEAARLAGMPVVTIRVSVYAISGGLAGMAAVLEAGRLTAASPTTATGIELTAGAAVLLGGTSFMGGRGTLLGTLLGVLFLGVLQNGLTLLGISPYWSGIVSGIVLIAAIFVDRLRTGRAQP